MEEGGVFLICDSLFECGVGGGCFGAPRCDYPILRSGSSVE
jgi:hypothetical protein